jgi:hypothetical protein
MKSPTGLLLNLMYFSWDDILSNITLNTLTLTFLIECGFSFKTGVVAFHLSELTWTIKWIPEKAATHDRIQ